MEITEQIETYLESQPEPKQSDLRTLHRLALQELPEGRLWFLDGKNSEGKTVTNPNIGYGEYVIRYADGSSKEFYQIGLSGNATGISVYVMGLEDKTHLPNAFGKRIGKATVTGYCIRFKALKDINVEVLMEAIRYGVSAHQGGA